MAIMTNLIRIKIYGHNQTTPAQRKSIRNQATIFQTVVNSKQKIPFQTTNQTAKARNQSTTKTHAAKNVTITTTIGQTK